MKGLVVGVIISYIDRDNLGIKWFVFIFRKI